MKNFIYFSICLTLSLSSNLRLLPSETNTYNYSNIKAIYTNTNSSNEALASTASDESVIYVSNNNFVGLYSGNATKTGDATNLENSKFYGVNSAVLFNKARGQLQNFNISTNAIGSHALCSINEAEVILNNSKLDTFKDNSSALVVTYGGKLDIRYYLITTTGKQSPCLFTDMKGGSISLSYGRMLSNGTESPVIYNAGNTINVNKVNTTSTESQSIVLESGHINIEHSYMRSTGKGSNNDDGFVVMYSKTKADTSFTAGNTSFYNLGGTDKRFFYVTNTKAKINVTNCIFQNESATFLNASGNGNGWGTQGKNGAEVELNLVNQKIESDIVVDSISQLTINMKNSTIKGKINNAKTASALDINLDASSSIELTGNSYYTSLNNANTTGSNINKNNFEFGKYEENFTSVRSGSKNINPTRLIIFVVLVILL